MTIETTNGAPGLRASAAADSVPATSSMSMNAVSQTAPSKLTPAHHSAVRATSATRLLIGASPATGSTDALRRPPLVGAVLVMAVITACSSSAPAFAEIDDGVACGAVCVCVAQTAGPRRRRMHLRARFCIRNLGHDPIWHLSGCGAAAGRQAVRAVAVKCPG